MDDIVIFSKSFEDHIDNLRQVFQCLRSSCISLKLSKCVFASDRVDFLGFELSKEGIRPQARLKEAINSYQRPTTRKELKLFLGLAGFYRSFIPKFTQICHPLNELTKDSVVFTRSEQCETDFQELKLKLSPKPVLMFPNLGEPFAIEVDASNYAVWGV